MRRLYRLQPSKITKKAAHESAPLIFYLFCLGILVAQQPVGFFVLLDGGETTYRRIETVIRIVVIALAYFSKQNRTGTLLHSKIMVQILLYMDALAWCQTDLGTGRYGIGSAVGMYRHIGRVVDLLIGEAVVDSDQHIAAAP